MRWAMDMFVGEHKLDDAALATAAGDRSVRLFGIEVRDATLDGAARWMVSRARHGQATNIAFLNAHCVNVMRANAEYRRALHGMDATFADGAGMRIAAKIGGTPLQDNVNGTDLFPVLCRRAAQAGVGIYLLGARDGIADAAGRKMLRDVPGLILSGSHHGYIAEASEEARVVEAINASGAGIVLVALGVPTQELWIARNRHRLQPAVLVGVGGLFDYYSGRIPRAPLAMRKVGLEWAWRLAMEPRRLARRYLLGNATFLARLAYDRIVSTAQIKQSAAR